jgi:hypothetical protein
LSLGVAAAGAQGDEVDRVLGSFTRTMRSPKRGYAIVRLALDLGLRAAEIDRLQARRHRLEAGTRSAAANEVASAERPAVARNHSGRSRAYAEVAVAVDPLGQHQRGDPLDQLQGGQQQ